MDRIVGHSAGFGQMPNGEVGTPVGVELHDLRPPGDRVLPDYRPPSVPNRTCVGLQASPSSLAEAVPRADPRARGAAALRRWHHPTMTDQPRAVDPPHAPNDARLDALLPSEMAAKASDVGARKAAAGLLPTFVLAVLAGAFVALGAAFATTVAAGSAGVVPYGFVRVARRARVLARPDPGDRRRRGAVHRQQPAGDGLGVAPDHPGVGRRATGGSSTRGTSSGRSGPRSWWSSRGSTAFGGDAVGATAMTTALTKVSYEPLAGVHPRDPVQRPRLPGRLAHLLGTHHHRQDPGDRPADRGVRGRWASSTPSPICTSSRWRC